MTFHVAIHSSFSMSAAIQFHSNGAILQAWTQKSSSTDPLISESKTALLALTKASSLKLPNLLFQGDSKIVIDSILLSCMKGSSAS